MRRLIGVLGSIVLLAATPLAVFATSPANDDFANAQLITPGSLPYSDARFTGSSTTEGSEPVSRCNGPKPSVWYRFMPSATGVYRADTIGSDYETFLDVYEGTTLAGLTAVDCNHDIDSTDPSLYVSRLAFRGVAGAQYYIRVGNTELFPGDSLMFRLVKVTPPANDNYANATTIGSLPFKTTVNNVNATRQSNEPIDNYCGEQGATTWFKYTPASNMLVWAHTFSTLGLDTILGVYRGSTAANAVQIGCSDDQVVAAGRTLHSGVTFRAKAGVTYRFQVGGYDGNSGNIRFRVSTLTPELNDNLANALVLSTSDEWHGASLRHASRQAGEPDACFAAMVNSVWYKFTAPSTQSLRAEADDASSLSNFNVGVAIYTSSGPGFGNLSMVDCVTDGELDFVAASGTTYYFQVASQYSQAPEISFVLIPDPTP